MPITRDELAAPSLPIGLKDLQLAFVEPLASDDDCDCADDIRDMKTGYRGTVDLVPDYHPYQASGDFNSDGIVDFAVVVIDRSKAAKHFALVVFNGSRSTARVGTPFMRAGLDLKGAGLFFSVFTELNAAAPDEESA